MSITVEHNKDGSSIVRLSEPVTVGNEELTRVTIPALRGKHMRLAPWPLGRPMTVGELIDFAARVVEPLGVVDELTAADARDVAVEVMLKLGKSPPTGEAPSPT